MVKSPVPNFLHGTWLGGMIAHSILIPLWTLSPLPVVGVAILLFSGGWKMYLGVLIGLLFAFLAVHKFEYRPWIVQAFYDLDLTAYYKQSKICGPHLDKIGHEKTLFSACAVRLDVHATCVPAYALNHACSF